ncbi:hypothetical protein Plhal304r1_c028g0092441 [Plasmopara halstedii]
MAWLSELIRTDLFSTTETFKEGSCATAAGQLMRVSCRKVVARRRCPKIKEWITPMWYDL